MQRRKPIRSVAPVGPRFEIFVVENFDGDNGAARTRIGFASESDDHQSFHIELTALPITGKLVMRLRNSEGL